MTPSLADLLPYLLAIAALALLMVYVIVQWSRVAVSLPALRFPAAGEPGGRPAVRWSLAYALAWGALIAAYLAFLDRLRYADPLRNLILMLLVAAGWLAINLTLVVFMRALMRVQGQGSRQGLREEGGASPEPGVSAGRWRPLSRGLGGRWERGSGGEVQGGGLRARLLDALRLARNLLLALLVVALGEALPPLQRLHAWTQAHQQPLLAVTISLTVVGFILLMGMAIHLVLTRGRPMSQREIEALAARRLRAQPALWRRSVYRVRGTAVGAEGHDSASFAEIKAAWKLKAWQVSPRWRRLFAGLLGTAFLATGLFGTACVLGPAGIQLLCGGALLYAWVRSVVAFARA